MKRSNSGAQVGMLAQHACAASCRNGHRCCCMRCLAVLDTTWSVYGLCARGAAGRSLERAWQRAVRWLTVRGPPPFRQDPSTEEVRQRLEEYLQRSPSFPPASTSGRRASSAPSTSGRAASSSRSSAQAAAVPSLFANATKRTGITKTERAAAPAAASAAPTSKAPPQQQHLAASLPTVASPLAASPAAPGRSVRRRRASSLRAARGAVQGKAHADPLPLNKAKNLTRSEKGAGDGLKVFLRVSGRRRAITNGSGGRLHADDGGRGSSPSLPCSSIA